MYQYSLQYFKRLFNQRLRACAPSDDLQTRLKSLLSDVTFVSFSNVCRGLFERDKLLYAFLLATSIERESGGISPAEWTAYMTGHELTEDHANAPDGIDVNAWAEMTSMEAHVPEIAGI